MDTIIKIIAILKEKGLVIDAERVGVIKQNEEALVIDNPIFETVFKVERKGFKELGVAYLKEGIMEKGLVIEGYFRTRERGIEKIKRLAVEELTKKRVYIDGLIKSIG